jgi:PKD repeat protein
MESRTTMREAIAHGVCAGLAAELCLLVVVISPAAAITSTPMAFVATLAGAEEVPPNESTARGTVAAILNTDDTVTYSVSSTGFDTDFAGAHVHDGPRGVVGPVMFPIDCSAEGGGTGSRLRRGPRCDRPCRVFCGGRSRPLTEAEKLSLVAGETYVNLHTAAFPDGHIRGQLVPVTLTDQPRESSIGKFEGKADPGNSSAVLPEADVRIEGWFAVDGTVDLGSSTAVITALLDEVGGAGELSRRRDGGPAVPIPLVLARYDDRGEATYEIVDRSRQPRCRLKITSRAEGVLHFSLRCKRGDGMLLPVSPQLCTEDRRPRTKLMTSIVVNAPDSVILETTQTWRCVSSRGRLRELKTVAERSSGGAPGGSQGGGRDSNRAPQAGFSASPEKGTWPLAVGFTNLSADPDGRVVAFGWNFGDGTGSVEESPVHTYTRAGQFTVTLVVRDDQGLASRPHRRVVTVLDNQPPRADFRTSHDDGEAPLTVLFMDRSTDADGHVVARAWDFGDGGGSTEAHPTHTYTMPGEFVVTLVVTDDRGSGSAPKRDVIVVRDGSGAGENRPPKADFRANPRRGLAPLAVTFTNRSTDADGDVAAFRWDFGDGSGSTAESPVHTYARTGDFRVTLVVTDNQGAPSLEKRETVSVAANRAPEADFRAEPRQGDAPLAVRFTNRSTDAEGEVVQFAWDFGDGATSTEENPTHVYVVPGRFAVTLTVTDDRGAASERPKRQDIEVAGATTSSSSTTTSGTGSTTTATAASTTTTLQKTCGASAPSCDGTCPLGTRCASAGGLCVCLP